MLKSGSPDLTLDAIPPAVSTHCFDILAAKTRHSTSQSPEYVTLCALLGIIMMSAFPLS